MTRVYAVVFSLLTSTVCLSQQKKNFFIPADYPQHRYLGIDLSVHYASHRSTQAGGVTIPDFGYNVGFMFGNIIFRNTLLYGYTPKEEVNIHNIALQNNIYWITIFGKDKWELPFDIYTLLALEYEIVSDARKIQLMLGGGVEIEIFETERNGLNIFAEAEVFNLYTLAIDKPLDHYLNDNLYRGGLIFCFITNRPDAPR